MNGRERSTVGNACRVVPGDRGCGLGDSNLHGLGDGGIVGGIGWGEGDRKSVRAGCENGANGRSVDEISGNRRRRIQLGNRKGSTVRDACWRSPGDHRSGLRDRQRDGFGDGGITSGVGRGERDRQRVGTSRGDDARRRRINKNARYGCRCI